MADTADLVAFARTLPGLNVVALVPNARGAARAIEAGCMA
jgi:hydroxymethylglutaryl-CoA lyase